MDKQIIQIRVPSRPSMIARSDGDESDPSLRRDASHT